MENRNLVYLSVEKLHPHPDNPRKEMRDVSELAESIKVKGIMQNLTVVPKAGEDGAYTVIIGHRRLTAAKMAGLKVVPCVIVEMSDADQVATMLLENIQRNDLTIYEQAKGFQMMLDLGDTVSGISEKSGFSETTIRRRVKLAELDEKKLKEACGRQITMGELDELNAIERIEDRNALLADIGTSNFKWKLQSVKSAERNRAQQQAAREALTEAGLVEIPYKDCRGENYAMSARYWIMCSEAAGYTRRNDEEFFALNHDSAYLCYKLTDEQKANAAAIFSEKERENAAKRDRTQKIRDLFKQAYELRCDFLEDLPQSVIMKKFDVITAFLFYMEIENLGSWIRQEGACEVLGFNYEKICENDQDILFEDVHAAVGRRSQEENIFEYVLLKYGDKEELTCLSWDGKYKKNRGLFAWYEFLQLMGYSMSDEEKELLDGSHELYEKE